MPDGQPREFRRAQPLRFRATANEANTEVWVFVLPVGRHHYMGEEWDFDDDYVRRIASETRRAIANHAERALEGSKPWTPPVRVEHWADGKRRGDVLDLKVAGEGEAYGLYARVDFRQVIYEAILADEYEYVSVGIWSMEDDAGEFYSPVLMELSLVDSPHLSNIGRIQDWLGLELSAASRTHAMTLTEADMSEIKELTDKIGEQAQTITTQGETIATLRTELDELKLELSKRPEPVEGVEATLEAVPAIDVDELATKVTSQVVAQLSRPGGVVPGGDPPAAPTTTLKEFVDAKVAEGMTKSEAIKLTLGKKFQ